MKTLSVLFVLLALTACGSSEKSSSSAPSISAPSSAKAPDEAAAIRTLTEINKAQADYMTRNRRYALTYDELIESHLLKQEPTADATGYEIKLRPAADAASYTVIADPVSGSPSTRHFFTDKTRIIRAEQGKPAGTSSPEVSS